MILRHHCVLLIFASFAITVHSDVLETSVLSVQPVESVVSTPNLVKLDPPKLERRSSFNGNVRADINTRITNALKTIREKIPTAVDSVEDDIAIANRDKVILALANFLGMVFGVLKATAGSTDWEAVSTGNKIQVFAQILYGYGYWGPFALEYETSRVDCGTLDFEATLNEYGYVTDHHGYNSLDPILANYSIAELNSKIKENLYCLTQRSSSNQAANELDAYIDVYTQLLSEKLGN